MDEIILKRINSFLEIIDSSPGFEKKPERLGGYVALIDRNHRKILSAKRVGYLIKNINEYHPIAVNEAKLLVGKKEINSYSKTKNKNANAIVAGDRILSLAGNFSKEIAEAILIAATSCKDFEEYVYIEDKKFGSLLVNILVARISEKRENRYIKFLMSI